MLALLFEAVIVVMLGAGATLAADQPSMAQDLEEKGAIEIAHGQLIEQINVICYTMPVHRQSPRDSEGCGPPRIEYGEFRRLKLRDSEFVCISFRRWACFESK